MNMVGLVPGFPQFILSPYLLMDDYDGVGPWISSISFLHIYLWMTVVGLVPGFPQFILSPYLLTVWMKI
jgi:hypothetical protein